MRGKRRKFYVKFHPEYGDGSFPAKLTESGRYHKSEDHKFS